MSGHHYQFGVVMSCEGCSGAVSRALNRLSGVTSVEADLKSQKVDVKTDDNLAYEDVLKTIQKTGKEVKGGKTVS